MSLEKSLRQEGNLNEQHGFTWDHDKDLEALLQVEILEKAQMQENA